MGSGNRKINSDYVVPDIGDGISVLCPDGFSRVPALTRTMISPDLEYRVIGRDEGAVAIGGRESVVGVLDAPAELLAAVEAGCHYVARFPEALDADRITAAEISLE